MASVTEPGVCQFRQAGQPGSSEAPAVSAPTLGLKVPGTVPPFIGVLESGTHASVAGILPTDPSPQAHVVSS